MRLRKTDPIAHARDEWRRSLIVIVRAATRWLFWVPLGYYLFGLSPVDAWLERRLSHGLPEIGFREALLLTLSFILLSQILKIEQLLQSQIERSRRFWTFTSREEAYAHICKLIEQRASRINRVELLQFSGDTAIPILKEIAKRCPGANVRLFLVPEKTASEFDEPGFHWNRVQHTKGALKVIKETCPGFNVKAYSYITPPSIAGVLVDDWLASAGWYIFKSSNDTSGVPSIRGHAAPAFVGIDEAAEPLRLMVQQQLEAVERGSKQEFPVENDK